MYPEIQTEMITGGVAVLSLILFALAALFGKRQNRRNRELIEYLGRRVEELEDALTQNRTKLESGSKGITEHARKIAWLEAKIRKPDVVDEDAVVGQSIADTRPNVTERRHRVLKLAARGHDAPTIAKTLGMMSGEVELIMNLKKAAAAAA